MPAPTTKATSLVRYGWMPIEAAAGSLPRSASRKRPVVPFRMAITPRPRTVRHSTQKMRYGRSFAMSIEPTSGRGTGTGTSPPDTQLERDDDALEHQGEGEGGQRRVDAGEPDDREPEQRPDARGEDRPDDHGADHREVVALDELRGGEGADGGEGALAQRDRAADAGGDDDREQDDREGDSRRWRGSASSRRARRG